MNPRVDADVFAAESRARVLIHRQLADAGWSVQDSKSLNRAVPQDGALASYPETEPQ